MTIGSFVVSCVLRLLTEGLGGYLIDVSLLLLFYSGLVCAFYKHTR